MAARDDFGMKPVSSHILLSRMEAARRETRHHLDLVCRQIAGRAERITITQKTNNRSSKRAQSRWTRWDEMQFRSHLQRLEFERRSEIEALSRKLARQNAAIQALQTKLNASIRRCTA